MFAIARGGVGDVAFYLLCAGIGWLSGLFLVSFFRTVMKLRSPEGRQELLDTLIGLAAILVIVFLMGVAAVIIIPTIGMAVDEYRLWRYSSSIEELQSIQDCEYRAGCLITLKDAERADELGEIAISTPKNIKERYERKDRN